MTPDEGPNAAMPELPEPKLSRAQDWSSDGIVVSVDDAKDYAAAHGDACYAAGVKAGMERAAGIAEDTIVAEYEGVESYGNLAAAAIRKEARSAPSRPTEPT